MPVSTGTRRAPFFDYSGLFAAHESEYAAIFRDVCSRGAFIKQRDLADFERELAEFLGARYVLGVGNATTDCTLRCEPPASVRATKSFLLPHDAGYRSRDPFCRPHPCPRRVRAPIT